MIVVAFVDSCDIFLKRYVVFGSRVPTHWLGLQSVRGDCPWEGTVAAELHLWNLPQSLAAWMHAFPRVPELLHDHMQFWTCETQQRECM